MVELITDHLVSFLNAACLQNTVAYHIWPTMIQCIDYFLLLLSVCKKQTSSGIIYRNLALQTLGYTPKHLAQVKMSKTCLKQCLFVSTLVSFSPAQIRQRIHQVWYFSPAYAVPREHSLLHKPFSLPCFVLHTFARADMDTIRCLSTRVNTLSGSTKVL